MSVENTSLAAPQLGILNPEFELLVHRIIHSVHRDDLADMRKDFHTRLRITLTHPDNTDLVEDLWDFFYDWGVFERKLPEGIKTLTEKEKLIWDRVKEKNHRGVFLVQKITDEKMKLKDLYNGKSFQVLKQDKRNFLGISKGDIIEGRLVMEKTDKPSKKDPDFSFVRKPSYHPSEVHDYIKKKVKQFRRSQDVSTYQSWLWLLVGMYLKHRIYQQMPVEKIYDDNSRI